MGYRKEAGGGREKNQWLGGRGSSGCSGRSATIAYVATGAVSSATALGAVACMPTQSGQNSTAGEGSSCGNAGGAMALLCVDPVADKFVRTALACECTACAVDAKSMIPISSQHFTCTHDEAVTAGAAVA